MLGAAAVPERRYRGVGAALSRARPVLPLPRVGPVRVPAVTGFTMKLRGAPPALIARDFWCTLCSAIFADLVHPRADYSTCECGGAAERIQSAVLYKPQRGAVRQGKVEPPPSHKALDTSKLADGMKLREFRKERRAMWAEERRREWKAKGLG